MSTRRIRLPPDAMLLHRQRLLEKLQAADGDWIEERDIPSSFGHRTQIISFLLRLGFLETRKSRTFRDELQVRIALDGRRALESGNLFYHVNVKSIQIPAEVLDKTLALAKNIGVVSSGRGSLTLLLRYILAREDAFTRWFKNVNAEELQEE